MPISILPSPYRTKNVRHSPMGRTNKQALLSSRLSSDISIYIRFFILCSNNKAVWEVRYERKSKPRKHFFCNHLPSERASERATLVNRRPKRGPTWQAWKGFDFKGWFGLRGRQRRGEKAKTLPHWQRPLKKGENRRRLFRKSRKYTARKPFLFLTDYWAYLAYIVGLIGALIGLINMRPIYPFINGRPFVWAQ